MKVTVSNVLTIENPTQEAIMWCEKNLVLINPEYTKKVRMGFWVGNTPPKLYLYEKHGEKLILPFGILRSLPKCITDNSSFISTFPKSIGVFYGNDEISLYEYQKIAVEAVYKAQYGILQSPTGSGKTQIGIALVKKYGRRALWLTHTLDLLRQSKARAELYIDKDIIGTITEGKVNIGSGITFATIQTMCKLDLVNYKDFWDLIIVDECHRCSGTPTAMTQFYKVLNNLAARHKIGLSATVHRSDGMIDATYALLGNVVHTVSDKAVGNNIMKVGILPVETGVKIGKSCLNTDGTINYTKLITYLTENSYRNDIIINNIKLNEGKSCLILSDRLKHLENLINYLPINMRKNAAIVSGKMTTKKSKAEREQAIEDMRSGKKKYLFATYTLAKEGLDIPCLERLFLTTPQKDYTVVTQSIGRIARIYEGKTHAITYDFIDNISYLVSVYRKRCAVYMKNNCYFCERDHKR